MIQFLIILYFLIIFCIGFYKKTTTTSESYLFASRKLTLPGLIATLVSTWYGGILAIGDFSYHYGIVSLIIFGLFYYIAACIFLLFIGPKIYRNNLSTIPAYFKKKLGFRAGILSSIIIIFITSPAPYIIILSMLIQHIFNLNYLLSIFISMSISIIYLFKGGFRSVINTDKVQFILMYLGFALMLLFLNLNYGGIDFLIANVPENNLKPTGTFSTAYIISWFFIAMITFIDPNIFQRIYSSKNESTVKKGLIYSIMFWVIFDLLTITTGLYASAIIPQNQLLINPYLQLADIILPDIIKALFFISLLSIVMSTIDSFTFTSSLTLGKDIYASIKSDNNSANIIQYTQIGIIVTSIISLFIILIFKNIIDIWYIFGTIGASSILVPFIMLLYNQSINRPLLVLTIPLLVCIIAYILSFNIEPLYLGLSSSIVLCYLFKD